MAKQPEQTLTDLWTAISRSYLAKEQEVLSGLRLMLDRYDPTATSDLARSLITPVRSGRGDQPVVEAFLREYQLNSGEGVILMGIAEALLRIPDRQTQDLFLQEKLSHADWRKHLQHSDSFWVNLSSHALLFTQQLEEQAVAKRGLPVFEQIISRLGVPMVRAALTQAMHFLAERFVLADSIEKALSRSRDLPDYYFSFDMLGEAALTGNDAARYFVAYEHALAVLGENAGSDKLYENPGLSVKLSALCPRYEPLQQARAKRELSEKLLKLALKAKSVNVSLTVDAEESERLDLSLMIFEAVFKQPELDGWPGLGLAVQAYQKRAMPVLRWLAALSGESAKIIPVRLVKGAYWDSEIKRAQENGLADYPVFSHKSATDVSYLACAAFLLSRPDAFYPQFASHNAHTLAAIRLMGKNNPPYEFQRLHGMGEALYEEIIAQRWRVPCRIYAPVGRYHELLPYLVRRLLENGANTSFVNQIDDDRIAIETLSEDPVARCRQAESITRIVPPPEIYGAVRSNSGRLNSEGLNLADSTEQSRLIDALAGLAAKQWQAYPLINGQAWSGETQTITEPGDRQAIVGTVVHADDKAIAEAMNAASKSFDTWRLSPVAERVGYLLKAADLFEQHRMELVSLCVREGGRTVRDALAEVREAVDYCRYYAQQALQLFAEPIALPGPVGEENLLYRYGRGVVVCISPWNFPVAIFSGQIAAALVAGNTVIAKPAMQTCLTAMRCIGLLHEAGVPQSVLHFLPAGGRMTGERLIPAPGVAGIVFTGSTETARSINRQLAQHQQAIVPLIAETGGQNAMIADSSALVEQLVQDAVTSAFNSAGQRCSALRVLFVQEEIAVKTIEMLIGAMQEITLGHPGDLATDIGPVISEGARAKLDEHIERMRREAVVLCQLTLSENLRHGNFFPPTLLELRCLSQLTDEIFGPVLHVIRYPADGLDDVIEAINATGYGLTLGIHSRIDATVSRIRQRVKAGNVYVNRNMIGAVVGVQPFGGMGLSGTGPKAGGPDYLRRLSVEQTLTLNTAAIGGNASLLAQDLI